jgi:hypothetical protein
LFAVACTMYMVCGYSIMYGGGDFTTTRHRRTSTSRSFSSRPRCQSSRARSQSA